MKTVTALLAIAMVFGMAVCNKGVVDVEAPEITRIENSSTAAAQYTIKHVAWLGHKDDFDTCGFYIDRWKQLDSPQIVCICSGKKATSGYKLQVQSVQIDDENNAVITVREVSPSEGAVVEEGEFYPSVEVDFKPWAKSVRVIDTDGKEYKKIDNYGM